MVHNFLSLQERAVVGGGQPSVLAEDIAKIITAGKTALLCHLTHGSGRLVQQSFCLPDPDPGEIFLEAKTGQGLEPFGKISVLHTSQLGALVQGQRQMKIFADIERCLLDLVCAFSGARLGVLAGLQSAKQQTTQLIGEEYRLIGIR